MKKRRHLRLKIYDEGHLAELRNYRITWWKVCLTTIIFALIFIGIGISIVWFTPLRTELPGYMEESQRSATGELLLKLDSIINEQEINQRYMGNLLQILGNDSLPADSMESSRYRHGHFTPEKLLSASEKESQFVLTMEQKDEARRKNAAQETAGRIDLRNLQETLELGENGAKEKNLDIKIDPESEIGSIGDGIVLKINSGAGGRKSVIVQHPSGYISMTEGLKTTTIQEGQPVKAKDPFGLPGRDHVTIRLWREGVALYPHKYISPAK